MKSYKQISVGQKILTVLIAVTLFSLSISAQEKPVDIVADQSEDTLAFFGINRTELTQEVTLELVVENLLGYEGAVTRLIPPKDSLEMIKLGIPKGKKWKWSSDYTWKQRPSDEERLVYKAKKKQEIFEAFKVDENPLILFYKQGCSRSKFAKESLERKKIPFKLINTTASIQESDRLSQLIKIENPENERYLFPVFLDQKELIYDIADLKGYMKSLVKNHR